MKFVGVAKPATGQSFCGDVFGFWTSAQRSRAVLIDGLGHGLEAYRAAQTALQVAQNALDLPLIATLELMDRQLTSSVGVVAALLEIDLEKRQGLFAGVGNIRARILSGRERLLESTAGVLGDRHEELGCQEFDYQPGFLVALYSDGISSDFELAATPVTLRRYPEELAVWILERCRLEVDDASVVLGV